MATNRLASLLLLLAIAASACSAPSAAPESAEPGRVSRADFQRHLTGLTRDMTSILSRVSDGFEAGDMAAVSAGASDLRELLRADEDWQQANADQILGGCYDDAAALYSNAVVWMKAGALQLQEYTQTQDRDALDNAFSLFGDGSRDLEAAGTALAEAHC